MKTKRIFIALFALFNLLFVLPVLAQDHHSEDGDCDAGKQVNTARAERQAAADSLDLLHFIPALPVSTEACAIPAAVTIDVTFNLSKNRMYGFYHGVKNADLYLVVISEAGSPVYKPVNGIRYKKGDYIGKGLVVADNQATAFAALELKPETLYRIDIYAANTNCAGGIIYTANPVYSAEKGTTATTVYNYYFGNLHSHSGYSDGNKDNTSITPAQDYAFAKDADCMDFLGIAEHNHFSSPGNPGMHLSDYHLGLQQAAAFTNNNPGFLALYGMEFGVISNGGHMVVYGIDSLLGWETISGAPNYDIFVGKYDYNGLYNVINRFKTTKAFGYFAHPDDSDYSNILNTAYKAVADSAIIGSALENGPAFSTEVNYDDYPSAMSYLQYYKGILAKGYHIGPTIDHDNHNLTFGRTARSRLVVLSPSLGKDDFMNAMRSRSFYATHSCTAILDFMVSGAEMGSAPEHAHEPAIVVSITDPSTSQQPSIRIYKGKNGGNLAAIIATGNGNSFTYTDNTLADGESAYYFADIRTGSARTISSPVWYHRNDNPSTRVNDIPAGRQEGTIVILENPVKNALHYRISGAVYTGYGNIQVTDLYGRVLYHGAISHGTESGSIDISVLPAGTYILSLLTDKGRAYRKFVKY
jgi:hypothetical protein